MRWILKSLGLIAAMLGTLATSGPAAQAATSNEACAYAPIDLDKYGGAPFENPEVVRSDNGVLRVTLNVRYGANVIAGCPVHLRSYNGGLVGPTLRVKPGDTMRILLRNQLPDNPPFGPEDHNTPHDFNTTNLHTHGLHVSPVGNSDNVLLRIEPGEELEYEIKIPRDHPPGTFWYHAHVHGSTALQASSGMAGALIIEGGLDDVPEIADAADQVLVFGQNVYDTNGVLESYEQAFGPTTWPDSHRQTLVSGLVAPTIRMRPGEVQRWRMIHAGVRESIMPILKRIERRPEAMKLAAYDAKALAEMPPALPMHEISVDGLALGRMDTWDVLEMQPGYRRDVLVKAPMVDRPTVFILTDGEVGAELSLLMQPEPERVLAQIVVAGKPNDMPLPDPAELAGLLPFEPITDAELTGEPQEVVFDIDYRICPPEGKCLETCEPAEEGCALRFMVNDRPFGHGGVRTLKVGTASKWTLASKSGGHPFHIHVNPFQSTRTGPDGKEQTVWRDTLFVRESAGPIEIRSRYERYIGRFVLHCHILSHEDHGMMELVEIVP